MKNKRIRLAFTCSCVVLAAACGGKMGASGNGNAAATTGTNAAAAETDESTKSGSKPGDIGSGKVFRPTELVDAVTVEKDTWKGKEVAVTGYVSGTSGAGDRQLLTIANDRETSNRAILCSVKGIKSDDVFTKTVEVRGKISYASTDRDYNTVELEPCELKR